MSDDKLNWAGASVGFSEADLRGGDETADETVAAELATLLPRLPRVKITPQTITQTIIDRWYGYETEYRQTIAELRAELAAANRNHAGEMHDAAKERQHFQMEVTRLAIKLAAANERAERAEAALADATEANTLLRKGSRRLRTDYLDVVTELAGLRERIGQESVQWGVRIYDDDPDEAIEPSSERQARQLAVAWQDEVEGSNPTAVSRTFLVGKWKAASDA